MVGFDPSTTENNFVMYGGMNLNRSHLVMVGIYSVLDNNLVEMFKTGHVHIVMRLVLAASQ